MASRDLVHNILAKPLVASAVVKTTLVAGPTNSLDTLGFESATLLISVGAYTDGTFTTSLYESNDNITFTAVAASDIIGGANLPPISTNAAQNSVLMVGYKGGMRYIALGSVVSGAPATGMAYSVIGILSHARHNPTF